MMGISWNCAVEEINTEAIFISPQGGTVVLAMQLLFWL